MDDALEFIELRASLRLLTKWQKLEPPAQR